MDRDGKSYKKIINKKELENFFYPNFLTVLKGNLWVLHEKHHNMFVMKLAAFMSVDVRCHQLTHTHTHRTYRLLNNRAVYTVIYCIFKYIFAHIHPGNDSMHVLNLSLGECKQQR